MNAIRISPRRLAPLALSLTLATLAAAQAAPPADQMGAEAFADHRLERMTERLDLSQEQQGQIRRIIEQHRADVRSEVAAVLTDAQRAEFDRLQGERKGRGPKHLAKALDLSAAQQEQVRAIMDEGRKNPDLSRAEIRTRIAAILTDEQRARFESMGRRGERGGRGGPEADPIL